MSSFDRIIDINLRGYFICAREALKHFVERPEGPAGGVIVFDSSVHQIVPKPTYVVAPCRLLRPAACCRATSAFSYFYLLTYDSLPPIIIVSPLTSPTGFVSTQPTTRYVSYACTKAAIGHMTATLALEYAERGVRVNCVGPGAIETPMNEAWTGDAAKRKGVCEHIPMGRPGHADEIAACFAFLASDDGGYVTGQTLFACGGLTLYPEFRTAWASE